MQQSNNPRVHILRFGLRGWATIGVATAVLVAAAVLATVLFVFFLPVLLLAAVAYLFLPKLRLGSVKKGPPADTTIIDGEFRVVDTNEIEEKNKGDSD
jgi:hypothetical protein